jgi:lipoprotein-anchoring transpeptidase ErfK/SrfK
MPAEAALLVVDAAAQSLLLDVPGRKTVVYRVSTSRIGLGEEVHSNKTPRGYHEIVERYGEGTPPGSVWKSRTFTGEIIPPEGWRSVAGDDYILSRILRLAGRESGFNTGSGRDSYSRMIYLHGTNQEQLLGRVASLGCLRLANRDIIDLYNQIASRPAWCWIG